MNENLDLTRILKECPKGTKLFCPEYGYVKFVGINSEALYFPIVVDTNFGDRVILAKDGYTHSDDDRDEFAEPSLYPAHDQRDWSKFKASKLKVNVTLHPFDKVLARGEDDGTWVATFVTDFGNTDVGMPYLCLNRWNKYCIPYNKDTAHLIGTIEDCPIDYEIEFSKEFKEE
jgi:hypothetical protein